jgi:type II secretory pathway component GspD/PulD (secretin)
LELVRSLTRTNGEREFEIIRLRSGSAVEIAKLLDEALNGRGTKETERARIVADPATNSLIVKATPLELLTIRRLLRGGLDSDGEGTGLETRTLVIGPLRHAVAAHIASVLQAVYRTERGQSVFSAAADPRTNTLVLRCPLAVYDDVFQLMKHLDVKSPDKPK